MTRPKMLVAWLAILAAPGLAAEAADPPVEEAVQIPHWKTATELPDVDLAGLSPEQKELALEVLRELDCPCGCGMKLAQCRIEDRDCRTSPRLALGLTSSTFMPPRRATSVRS